MMDSASASVDLKSSIESRTSHSYSRFLNKKIHSDKDISYFKTNTPAYKNILRFIDLLCNKIKQSRQPTLNMCYRFRDTRYNSCGQLIDRLSELCDQTDLSQAEGSAPLRFGHIAFRDWYDKMLVICKEFISHELFKNRSPNEQMAEELFCYLSESFGNRMRIDYGTGHELNFIIFIMGTSCIEPNELDSGDISPPTKGYQHNDIVPVNEKSIQLSVEEHGLDIIYLFAFKYLYLCRRLQTKFRLEPAGSRGVYNMDDFQYLPFLIGAAQLVHIPDIDPRKIFTKTIMDNYKEDMIFIAAVDFILNNKNGPFEEHSYTLWCLLESGSWETIYRRIRLKFTDDVLGSFPLLQHLLFGKYIFVWEQKAKVESS